MPLALLTAIGSTGAMVALAASQRTASAYDDYLRRADVADVIINPGFHTVEIERAIHTLPGVEQVATDYLFTVTIDGGAPRTRYEIDKPVEISSYALVAGDSPGSWEFAEEIPDDLATIVNFFGSPDGGHSAMSRPVVVEGRLATGEHEVMLNVAAAQRTGIGVGDTIPLAFWEGTFTEDSGVAVDYQAYLTEVVDPLGIEQAEVVGIVTMPDEVLPDGLYPRERAILSPDLTARYRCAALDVEVATSSLAEVIAAATATPCASSYPYYWLRLADGASDVPAALDEFIRRSTALGSRSADDPASGDGPDGPTDVAPPQYSLFSTETEPQAEQVRQSIQPTVAALVVLGLAAAGVTVALVVLAAVRALRSTERDQREWYQLGMSRRARCSVLATPAVASIAVGSIVGLLAGWLLDTGPVGMVAAVEPDPARELSALAVLAVAGIAVVCGSAVIAATIRSTMRAGTARPSGTATGRRSRRAGRAVGPPAFAHGVGAAYRQRAAAPMIAGLALTVTTMIGTSVFAASMSRLVDSPRAFGWVWDLGAVHGFGYGGVDLDSMAEVLDDDPAVVSWTALGFRTGVSLNGRPVAAIVGYDQAGDVDLTMIDGRLPVADDEVAIGQIVSRDTGVKVGDTVDVHSTGATATTATVTGIVVLPTLGQFNAETTLPGSGVFLPQAAIPAEEAAWGVSFIGVELHPTADPQARDRVLEAISRVDPDGVDVSLAYPSAVRPPAIIDARSTLVVPVAVSAGFAAVSAIALAAAAWASTRVRRRELAILRTVGFSSAQVRASIRVQSLATVLAALAVALPVGLLLGRSLWRAFARQLGVAPDPASAWTLLAAALVAGVVVSVLAAEIPARLAARTMPAAGLRAE